MLDDLKTLIETLNEGMTVDALECFRKLTQYQFAGNAGRGFGELIQNLIDSYPAYVPIEKRRGEISTYYKKISITDYGIGLSLPKIKLLVTLGGTDKAGNPDMIGQFGIGFFAMFNPKLYTKKIEVITKCHGEGVKILFRNSEPGKLPQIICSVMDEIPEYSTRITVWFGDDDSVQNCLNYALETLKYTPVHFEINGQHDYYSVWSEADRKKVYSEDSLKGFLSPTKQTTEIIILCKYMYVGTREIACFSKGGYNLNYDLSDYLEHEIPYLPGFNATINQDRLNLTLSRDGFYLDENFDDMVRFLRMMLIEKFLDQLSVKKVNNQTILANVYIFQKKIKKSIQTKVISSKRPTMEERLIKILINEKIFQVEDKHELFSISDIAKNLTPSLPLFFSPRRENTYWLGGHFQHDFVVLPSECTACQGVKSFYDDLFGKVFTDVVNLDTIWDNQRKIDNLVKRGIINPEDLIPKCFLIKTFNLHYNQQRLLASVNELLSYPSVISVISRHLKMPLNKITAAFFSLREGNIYISAGLFDQDGLPLAMDNIKNVKDIDTEETQFPGEIILGLRANHALIDILVNSEDQNSKFYILTYLAHEIIRCQKLLVPHSGRFNQLKEKLATDLRRVLMDVMVEESFSV